MDFNCAVPNLSNELLCLQIGIGRGTIFLEVMSAETGAGAI
jgi:hypothetical protein